MAFSTINLVLLANLLFFWLVYFVVNANLSNEHRINYACFKSLEIASLDLFLNL